MTPDPSPLRRAAASREGVLAVAFGLLSVPWTYAFEALLPLPLWPSFVASASVFAAGGGLAGTGRSLAANLAGIAYAAATLAIVEVVAGGGPVPLSLAVGAFMFAGSLHALAPAWQFPPGVFLGYAVLFSVTAAGPFLPALGPLPGASAAAGASMVVGAGFGLAADAAADGLARGATAG